MAERKTYKDLVANEVPNEFKCQCKCGHAFDFRSADVFEYKYGNVKTKYKACPRCGKLSFYHSHYGILKL